MFTRSNKMWYFVTFCCTFWILAEATSECNQLCEEQKEMDAPEICKTYGYPMETHFHIINGYNMTFHRIPYGRKTGKSDDKTVVLLQHALLCSSDNWLLAGPEKGLAFVLADHNYDVWMPNQRGVKYSRQHVNLTDKDPEFWDFSWHELGADDMPHSVDFILEQTGASKLMYIGHSQGTTSFFTFLAQNPDYSDKIIAAFLLAAVAYMKHAFSPLFKGCALLEELCTVLDPKYELLFNQEKVFNEIAGKFCTYGTEICDQALFLLMGYDDVQTNKSNIPLVLAHTPAGQSIKQVCHYCQNGDKWVFRQYDFGVKNIKKYGQATPPDYDLGKILAPVYLYYGPNDALAGLEDVERLKKELGNLKKAYKVPFELFNHIDFLVAKDVDELVYRKLLEDMDKEREREREEANES